MRPLTGQCCPGNARIGVFPEYLYEIFKLFFTGFFTFFVYAVRNGAKERAGNGGTGMEYVLTADSLCKRYGHNRVLDGLSMRVPKGAVYGLVGKNGAGKTTLIRLICGLQEPTSGSFTLYGADSRQKGIEKARRRMGAVVETPSLYPFFSAEENLRQQYRILGKPSFEGIPKLLELVGLQDTGSRKVKHFSLGMKQRLGIAVALAGDPDLLVLDEPVNGLDPQGIIGIRELILKLNREFQITVLISSHILDELSKLATHYGFLDGGRMVKEVSAEALEMSFRRCLQVEVTDTGALARVLEEMGAEYKILSESRADIYADLNITKLVTALLKEGCELFSVREREESLESYYLNLMGGKRS